MATIVLRVRLIGGDRVDVTFDGPPDIDEDRVTDHIVETLSQASGVLRTTHAGRQVVLFGRGVAAVEIAPRGPVV
ncbi:MAG TPA: hypothetical protein VF163_03870 [Micromonosporaceae bacterium]